MIRLRCHLWAALTVVLVGACAIPTNDDPQLIAQGNVPAVLIEGTTSTTTSTAPEAPPKTEIVYFIETADGQNRVHAVERKYPVGTGIRQILADLMTRGPDGAERPEETGLRTSLTEVVLVDATLDGDVLVVDVRGLFGDTGLQAEGQVLAAAQIVFTALEDDEVAAVRFLNDGEPVAAPVSTSDPEVGAAVDASFYETLTPVR